MFAKLMCCFFILVNVIACSPDKTPEAHFSLGQTAFNNGHYNKAIIHFKNVLTATSETQLKYLDSKYFLATAYNAIGDHDQAERFWRDLLDLNYRQHDAIAGLSHLYYRQSNLVALQHLIEKNLGQSKNTDELLGLYQVLVMHRTGDTNKALKKLNSLSRASQDTALGQYTSAFVLSNKQPKTAIERLSQLIEHHKEFSLAWFLRGQLKSSLADYAGAYSDYAQFLKLDPSAQYAHFLLAVAAQKQNNIPLMQQHVDILLSQNANQPLSNHLQALIDYRNSNFEQAKYHAELSIQNGLNNSTNYLIAGISSANLNQFENAYRQLKRIQTEFSQHQGFLRVFSWVQLKLGLLNDALEQYQQLHVDSDTEFHLGNLLAKQLIAKDQSKQAEQLLNKLQQAPVSNPMLRLEQGILQLNTGNKAGLEIIKNITLDDNNDAAIRTAHILALADQGAMDDAMQQAIDWHLDNKDNVLAINLIALLHQKNNKLSLAAKWLRYSLQLEPNNVPALLHLGFDAISNKQFSEATLLFKRALHFKPNHPKALSGLIQVQKVSSDHISWEAIIALADLNDVQTESALIIASHLYQSAEYTLLNKTLAHYETKANWPLPIWKIWIRNLLALKDPRFESELYKLSELRPDEQTYLFVISVLEEHQRYPLVLNYIQWLESESKSTNEIQYAKANALLFEKQLTKAAFLIKKLSEKTELPSLAWLEGKLLIEQGEYNEGLAVVANFFNQHPTRSAMIELATAAKRTKRYNHVVMIAEHYLSQAPNDHGARAMISNWLLTSNPKAALEMLDVPQSEAFNLQHWQISNNLGWLHLAIGEASRALLFTQNAYQKQGGNQQVALNYARALLANNQKQRALDVLQNVSNANADIQQLLQQLNQA